MNSLFGRVGTTVAFCTFAATGFAAPCAPDAPGACTEMLLESSVTWDGAPIKYLRTRTPELTIRSIQFAPGVYNDWHIHEAPVYIYVMQGSFEVVHVDGRRETWNEGEAFNEVMNTPHYGGNPGSVHTKLVIMSPSIADCPFMTPWPLTDGPQCKESGSWFDGREWWRTRYGDWTWGWSWHGGH
jgi:quercetin dioxygenase-like cupin family protein